MVYSVAKASEALVLTWTVPLPVRVPAPEMTSPAVGVKTLEASPMVKVPPTAKLPLEVTEAPLARVRLKKVGADPEVAMDAPLFKVMVPELGAKAAVVVRAPPTVAELEAVLIAALIFKPA